jgi:hypothetical protein
VNANTLVSIGKLIGSLVEGGFVAARDREAAEKWAVDHMKETPKSPATDAYTKKRADAVERVRIKKTK